MTEPRNRQPVARPVVLCILDGWGERAERADNAVAIASTPNWDRMVSNWPHATAMAVACSPWGSDCWAVLQC